MTTIQQTTLDAPVGRAKPRGSPTDPLLGLQISPEQRLRGETRSRRGSWRPKAWQIGVLLAVVTVGFSGTWFGLRSKVPTVQVATVLPESGRRGGSRGLLVAGGYVQHPRIVHVVPRVSGVVATLNVSEGDVVDEGDIIATLDRAELEQEVAENRAQLRATEAQLAELSAGRRREEIASARAKVELLRLQAEQLERDNETTKILAKAGAVSSRVGEGAENESLVANKALEAERQALALLEAGPRAESVAAMRANVAAARARLSRAMDHVGRTEIRAPLSGRVLRKFVEVGAVVTFGLPYTEGYDTLGPGSPIVTIGQLEGLEAAADISQADLGRVSIGGKVEVGADAFPGKTYPARVSRFSSRADRNKNTIEVVVRFDGPVPKELVHDMSVKLSFMGADADESDKRELMIPPSAVVERGGTCVVFVVEDGSVSARQVKVGPESPLKLVPVIDGLIAGEVVVVEDPEALKDGMRVAPVVTR